MYRIFRHYVPRTLLILGFAEAAILLVSVYIGVTLRLVGGESDSGPGDALFSKAMVFSLIMIMVMTAMGLYQRDLREGPRAMLVRLGLSFAAGLIVMMGVKIVSPHLFVGQGAFGIALLASFLGIVSCRFLCVPRTDSRLSRRVLILGVGNRAMQIAGLRRRSDRHGVTIVGFVDLGTDPRVVQGRSVFQVRTTLFDLAHQHDVDEIVVAMDERRNKLPLTQILECKMKGVRVLEESTYLERQLGKIRLDTLQPSSVVFTDGFTQAVLKPTGKRLFDVVVSVILVLLTSPIMLIIALAILVESGGRGPIFYSQERVGRGGRTFRVLKFRSMCVDAEKDGVEQWAAKDDDRITGVGRIIRKARMDEMPQFLNVLNGDMSFVGPRPERPQFARDFAAQIPYFDLRHHVKPGITGWAQVCYPYGASVHDAREKLQYDLYYLKNYSLFLDLMIIVQTLQVVLWGKGSR